MAANSSNWSGAGDMPLQPALVEQDMYIVVLTTVLIAMLIVITIAGNSMVLIAFCLCKELRSITNYFLVSLSVADLLTAILAMPIFLLLRITNEQWNFPGAVVFSKIFTGVDIICGTASIWNLCLISLDRFLAIDMPLKHMVILTPRRAQVVIVVAWCFALSMSPLLYMVWSYKVYPIVILSFFLPLSLIIFSYVKIYQIMSNRSFVHRRRAGAKLKRDFRMAKQMILVIGSFIVCWFGFFVVNIILAEGSIRVDSVILNIVKVLTYLNSCINPLLFTFISHKFKVAFTQMFHCHKPDLRKPTRMNVSKLSRCNTDSCYPLINYTTTTATHSTPKINNGEKHEQIALEKETCV